MISRKKCTHGHLYLLPTLPWRLMTSSSIVESKEIITRFRLLANSREMREGLAIGFHAVTFLQFAFAVFYDYTYTIVPYNVTRVHRAFGGKFKFLTFWDAVSIYRSLQLQTCECATLIDEVTLWYRYTCTLHTEYTHIHTDTNMFLHLFLALMLFAATGNEISLWRLPRERNAYNGIFMKLLLGLLIGFNLCMYRCMKRDLDNNPNLI